MRQSKYKKQLEQLLKKPFFTIEDAKKKGIPRKDRSSILKSNRDSTCKVS
jgi:hypothetical protein